MYIVLLTVFLLVTFQKNKTPSSSGVNVFAQNLSRECNPYVFPPFALIFPVLRYLQEQKVKRCTFIAPLFSPIPVLQPFLNYHCINSFIVGEKGEPGILCFPSKKGYFEDKNGLRWRLINGVSFIKTPFFTE